jgi:hypothetical protein
MFSLGAVAAVLIILFLAGDFCACGGGIYMHTRYSRCISRPLYLSAHLPAILHEHVCFAALSRPSRPFHNFPLAGIMKNMSFATRWGHIPKQ